MVRPLLLSAGLFLVLLGGGVLLAGAYLIEPGPEGRLAFLNSTSLLLLHRYGLVEELTPTESAQLYRSSCTRKCHSKDVIELTPRTAIEWEQIVDRMGVPDRADLTLPQRREIIEYLQLNYLSNVPTILPDATMRFVKKHLWRLDFGDDDLYFDVIFVPRGQRSLMPYLSYNSRAREADNTLFIVYLNTHSGRVPRWNLAEMVTLRNREETVGAQGWQVLYEDGQLHHRQGILTFPALAEDGGEFEMVIEPPALKGRVFQWKLPIPAGPALSPPAAAAAEGS